MLAHDAPAAAMPSGGAHDLPGARLSTTFEAARVEGGGVVAAGLFLRPMTPAEARPDLADALGPGGGGALGLIDLGPGAAPRLGGASGRAVSTLGLGWPYGFVLELDQAAGAVSAVWAAANEDWQATVRGADGAALSTTVISAGTQRLEVSAPAGSGIRRLELRSLGGWDWVLLDALSATPSSRASDGRQGGPRDASPPPEAPPVAAVPLPPAAALLLGALGLIGGARRARRALACGAASG